MSRPISTNPEYAALAYRKAMLSECVAHLKSFTSFMGMTPKGKIVSEDVPREDSEVPEEELLRFMTDLQQEHESIRLEMAKFDFVRRGDDVQDQRSTQEEKGGRGRRQEGRQKGKRRRR